ncbi:MAG: DPP IV N-terminal domain-containing protein [Pyrinomonadaceae bacterium]|nr:DPP IV N-terminal domain-containing protein [Pyrinomonadaceae bacterium]
MSSPPENLFSFAEYRIDTAEKLLSKGEDNISLPPKVMDILCLLVKKRGKIVSKNEIMETVWADSFVEESNLTQSIYTLRRTLGNDIIETVPRRGFRIAVPVLEAVTGEEFVSEEKKTKFPTPKSLISIPQLSLIVIGLLALSLLAFLAYNYFKAQKNIVSPFENVAFQKLTSSGNISSPTISPDGKSIAFVRGNDLYLQDVNTGSSVKLNVVNHQIFSNLRFSLDGETLYFRNESRTDAGGDVFQVSRFGGEARKILENSWSSIGLSPDGKKLSFVRYFPNEAKWVLFIRDLQNGEDKQIFERSSPDSIYRTGFPAWSPDSKKIVTVAQEKPASTIYVIDAETGNSEKQNTPRFVQIEQTIWNSQGNAIFLVGREKDRFFQLWKLYYPSGETQRITNDLSTYRHISLSADGKNLIAENQTTFAHLWTTTTENLDVQKQITLGNINRDGLSGLTWTPDGNLVYSSRQTGETDLWSLQLSDNSAQQLTKNAGQNNENPIVSTDGKFIYFESNRTNSRHIWRIDTDGKNPTQITFSEKENEFFPALSPDGNWLYFLKKSSQGNVILRQNLQDKRLENITEQGAFSPNSFILPSPNGKLLAFNNIKETKSEEGNTKISEIGIVYLEEQNKIKIFRFPRINSSLTWTPDSKSFDYYENSPEEAKLWRRTLDETAEPKLLLAIPKTSLFNFAWSTDGKNLALARGKQERDVVLLRNFE